MSRQCASALTQKKRNSAAAAPAHTDRQTRHSRHMSWLIMPHWRRHVSPLAQYMGSELQRHATTVAHQVCIVGCGAASSNIHWVIPCLGCARTEQTPCHPSLQCWTGSGRPAQHSTAPHITSQQDSELVNIYAHRHAPKLQLMGSTERSGALPENLDHT